MSENGASAVSLKGKRGMVRVLNAARYSFDGLRLAYANEAAFRELVYLNCLLQPVAVWVEVSPVERALLILVLLMTLVVELFNTAIENAVDLSEPEIHPLAKAAKDMGSAAQFVMLLGVTAVWTVILVK